MIATEAKAYLAEKRLPDGILRLRTFSLDGRSHYNVELEDGPCKTRYPADFPNCTEERARDLFDKILSKEQF